MVQINILVETLIRFQLVYTHLKRSHTMTKLIEQLTKFFQTAQQSRLEQYINSKNPTNAA